MSDWLDWHHTYDDPASSLARRLEVVKRQLSQALDQVTRDEAAVAQPVRG